MEMFYDYDKGSYLAYIGMRRDTRHSLWVILLDGETYTVRHNLGWATNKYHFNFKLTFQDIDNNQVRMMVEYNGDNVIDITKHKSSMIKSFSQYADSTSDAITLQFRQVITGKMSG